MIAEVSGNTRIANVVRSIMGGLSTVSLAALALPVQAQQAAPPAQPVQPAQQNQQNQQNLIAQQAAQQPAAASGDDSQLQEVVVTGLRASLQESLEIKRNADGIVDAISAEDIGKFPDSNLGDSLARIPGVTITRANVDPTGAMGPSSSTGAATQVTVRGFGPQFNETLYDGREVPTASGNRGFDFGAVGSDLVSQLDVLKTPDSSLSSGAIGATINIKYPKPFDHPGFQVAGTLSASDSSGDNKVTPNGDLIVSDTFFDNRFGILVAGAYTDTKNLGNHVDIQGWEGLTNNDGNTNGLKASQMANGATPPTNAWYIQDYGVYQEHNNDEHEGGRLVLQARPVDGLEITLDDNYSVERVQQIQQGFSAWFSNASLENVTTAPNGTVTSFSQPNTPTDFQAAVNGSVVQDNTSGLNVKWDIDEHNSFMADAYTAFSKLNPGGSLSQLDADIGYGDTPALNNNLGVVVPGGNALPYPTNYGPGGNASEFTGVVNGQSIIGSHVMVLDSQQNSNTINQFKLEGAWHDDTTRLKYGVQFTHNGFYEQSVSSNPYSWQMYSGYGQTGGVLLPSSLTSSTYSTGSDFINGWSGGNLLPASIVAANGSAILNYLTGLNGVGANPGACTNSTNSAAINCSGVYTMYGAPVSEVSENTLAPYISLATIAKIGSMPLHIQVGARWEDTKVQSSGYGQVPTALNPPTSNDPTLYHVIMSDYSLQSGENEYRYLLPNLDLGLDVTDTVKARLDLSRTLTRPDPNALTPVVAFTSSPRIGSLTGSGGNPDLLPYLSDNIDLGGEWYYARNSYVSVDAFVKELTNFIVQGTVQETVPGVTLPGGGTADWDVSADINGPSAEVRGVELGVQHMFWDTGFGFSANATFVGTSAPYNPNNLTQNFAVTGLANSWNFVPFYENHGFMIRLALNHQAAFLNSFGQHQTTGDFGSEPVFVNASTYLDLSTSYQINTHLSVFFEALNLTNEVFATHGRYTDQVLDVIDTGRTYNLGVHFKL